jgi:hypothetical protein
MKLTWKHYIEIGGDVIAAVIAYAIGHWLGFAIAVLCIACVYAHKAVMILQTTRDVLLSRLPDRCAICHREIVGEGGVTDFDLEGELKIFHAACADKIDAMKEKRAPES